ncbi:glutamine amidotransferase [Paraburkholderia rhizosphaerae]|uniref:Putative membrane protein n=1 Tax=Paraburkholderia rhizosphaerae TaxID=480658 RepID=A0A4R8M381_9BURK|nr:glutamine amidotransferase [Paraburkholderia rhizosphaerae]TDY54888.1 putative membrane protein [Paraburkholderia rhizosphaerae]
MNKKVLLAGESWTSTATHAKGFDQFASITHHNGAEQFLALFERGDYAITYMPSHDAQTHFPMTLEALNEWDAVILSDIGANTLLLHPDTWINSQRSPNRLKLLRDYVAAGGGLMMIGGYLSFQGINGSARFRNTPVEEVLPVRCLPYDDRVEVPEGFTPECVTQHPLVHGIDGAWPHLLGYNEVELKPDATLVMQVPGTAHPLLAAGQFGAGRTLAWTSDMSVHWLPPEFSSWHGYERLWRNSLDWLTRRNG